MQLFFRDKFDLRFGFFLLHPILKKLLSPLQHETHLRKLEDIDVFEVGCSVIMVQGVLNDLKLLVIGHNSLLEELRDDQRLKAWRVQCWDMLALSFLWRLRLGSLFFFICDDVDELLQHLWIHLLELLNIVNLFLAELALEILQGSWLDRVAEFAAVAYRSSESCQTHNLLIHWSQSIDK